MVNIDRPCCGSPLAVEVPLPDWFRCEDCAVGWTVTEPEPQPVALAA